MNTPERKPLALDVGCGVGSSAGFYSLNKDALRIGIDSNKNFLEEMRAKEPGSSFILASAEHLPFKNEMFARVYCTHVLEHLKDPQRVMEEIRRVLVPNGQLVVSAPTPGYEALSQKISPEFRKAVGHQRIFSLASLKELVENSSFEVTTIRRRYGITTLKDSVLFLINRFFWKKEIEPQTGRLVSEFQGSSGFLGKHVQKLGQMVDTLIFVSENRSVAPRRHRLMAPFRWLNHLCPWEIYIKAVKR